MSQALGAARMVANMLERDGTPARTEAAQELLEAVACQEQELLNQRMSAAYYKAVALKGSPPHVPSVVRVLREKFGDPPFVGAGVAAGEHECQCNRYGAVSVLDRGGKPLGLRLDEFEPVAWRENDQCQRKGFRHENV